MDITRHHRLPKSKGGNGHVSNISLVKENKHRAYHLLFDNKGVQEVADILNKVWIDPAYELIVRRREMKCYVCHHKLEGDTVLYHQNLSTMRQPLPIHFECLDKRDQGVEMAYYTCGYCEGVFQMDKQVKVPMIGDKHYHILCHLKAKGVLNGHNSDGRQESVRSVRPEGT